MVICPKFGLLCIFFIHNMENVPRKRKKHSNILSTFHTFSSLVVALEFTKPTFSLPSHPVLREIRGNAWPDWSGSTQLKLTYYGDDWGVVFNTGASQMHSYKPDKPHYWHCVCNMWFVTCTISISFPSFFIFFKRMTEYEVIPGHCNKYCYYWMSEEWR